MRARVEPSDRPKGPGAVAAGRGRARDRGAVDLQRDRRKRFRRPRNRRARREQESAVGGTGDDGRSRLAVSQVGCERRTGVVSTVNVLRALRVLVLPFESVAVASTKCVPSERTEG